MERDIERECEALTRRYLAAPRHTMQVDFNPFLHQLAVTAREGRARAQDFRPPIPARAAAAARSTESG